MIDSAVTALKGLMRIADATLSGHGVVLLVVAPTGEYECQTSLDRTTTVRLLQKAARKFIAKGQPPK